MSLLPTHVLSKWHLGSWEEEKLVTGGLEEGAGHHLGRVLALKKKKKMPKTMTPGSLLDVTPIHRKSRGRKNHTISKLQDRIHTVANSTGQGTSFLQRAITNKNARKK